MTVRLRVALTSASLLSACSPGSFERPVGVDELAVAVTFDAEGRPVGATASAGSAPENIEVPDSGALLLFIVSRDDLVAPDGTAADLSGASARMADSLAPETSCRRCLAPLSGPPALVSPGDRCFVPWFATTVAYRNAGGQLSELSEAHDLEARARASVVVDWAGECEYPFSELSLDSADPEACAVFPKDDPWLFHETLVLADGTFVGLTPGRAIVASPGRPSRLAELPSLPVEAATSLPGGLVLAALEDPRATAEYVVIDPRSMEVAQVSGLLPRPAELLRLSSGELLVSGEGAGLLEVESCRVDDRGFDCRTEPFPFTDPECFWVYDVAALSRMAEGGGFVVAAANRRGALALRTSAGEWVCQSDQPRSTIEGSSLVIDDVAELVAHDQRVVICGTATIDGQSFGEAIVSARVDAEGQLVDWSVLHRSMGSCAGAAWLEQTQRFRVLLASSMALDFDVTGSPTAEFTMTGVGGDLWPDVPQRVVEIATSTSGFVMVTGASYGYFIAPSPSASFDRVYGQSVGSLAAIEALTDSGERSGCLALSGEGDYLRVSQESPSACGAFSVERSHIEGGVYAAKVARAGKTLLAATALGDRVRLQLIDLEAERATADLDVPIPARAVLDVVHSSGDRFLVAVSNALIEVFADTQQVHLVESVADDPATPEVESPSDEIQILAIDAVGGVAWVTGVNLLGRVTPGKPGQPATLQQFWYSREWPEGEEIIDSRISGVRAIAPDRIVMLSRDRTENVSERERLVRTIESRATYGDVSTKELTTFSGILIDGTADITGLEGEGGELTILQKRRVLRPSAHVGFLPFDATAIADCHGFMLLGGSAEHMLALLPPE